MANITINIGDKSKRRSEDVLVRMPVTEAKMMKGCLYPVQDQLEDIRHQQKIIYEIIVFPQKYALVNKKTKVVDNIIVYHPELDYLFTDHSAVKIVDKCKIGMKYDGKSFYKDNFFYRIKKWMNI